MKLLTLVKTKELRTPLIKAWAIAFIIMLGVPLITGQIYGAEEAKQLLESVQKASLYFCSAIAASAATIMALMLTVLSLTYNNVEDKDKLTYLRLQAITSLCVMGFTGAVVLLLVISFPVVEFEKVPPEWFEYVYYVICVWNGVLAGVMISTILVLQDTANYLIGILSPDFDEEGDEET